LINSFSYSNSEHFIANWDKRNGVSNLTFINRDIYHNLQKYFFVQYGYFLCQLFSLILLISFPNKLYQK
jgi:hypothetical protein